MNVSFEHGYLFGDWFNFGLVEHFSMKCATGGFRALRSHVKAAKESLPAASDRGERSESPRGLLELAELDVGAKSLQCNQERLWDQENQLKALRIAVMKEQQHLQTRERSIRSMQQTLDEEAERVADKERTLDTRILEITRLEARLYEALLQQEQKPQQEPQQVKGTTPESDREHILALRERELLLARAKVAEKDKHLQVKERVLNEKEAELANFQDELERKSRDVDSRLNRLSGKLNTAHAQQMDKVEAVRLELEARRRFLEEREVTIAYQESAARAQAVALEQFHQLECSLMIQEDHLACAIRFHEKLSAVQGNDCNDRSLVTPEHEHQQPAAKGQLQRQRRNGALGRFFK